MVCLLYYLPVHEIKIFLGRLPLEVDGEPVSATGEPLEICPLVLCRTAWGTRPRIFFCKFREIKDNIVNIPLIRLVIHSMNINKYYIKCLNSLILSIYKVEVDNLYIKSVVNNFIKNGDVKLEYVPRWGNEKQTSSDQLLIYYRFIVRFK